MRRVTLLIVAQVIAATACALNSRPTLSSTKMAEFWQEPTNLTERNLLHGPGGAELAPDPESRYTLLEADDKGFSPGYDVRDERGRTWSVKLGPEARTEVVVSRLVWAMGYHQPSVYYLPGWTLVDNGKVTREGPARFRLESPDEEKIGAWSWRDNPFLDTQPFAGLFVLMVLVNNWDLKTPQNVIYRMEREGQNPEHWYVVKDLGASLGKTAWWLPGTRDDLQGFEQEAFIKGVSGNRVKFGFQGAWREPQLLNSVTPNDVLWISNRLASLTPQQWLDGFRAGGYTEAEAEQFIRRLQQKVDEGLKLGSGSEMKSVRAALTK